MTASGRLRGLGGIRSRRALAAALVVTAAGAFAPVASAGWGRVGTSNGGGLQTPSLGLAGPQVVGVWQLLLPGGNHAAESATFTPTTDGSALGSSAKRTTIVSGWGSMMDPVLLGSTGPGGLQVMLSGAPSIGSPLDGTSFAQRNADGSWAAPIASGLDGISGESATAATAGSDGQTPVFVAGGFVVHVGATGIAPGSGSPLTGLLGGLAGAPWAIVGHDAAGGYWVAWYNAASAATGVYVVQINPLTGGAMGAAALAPQSAGGQNALLASNIALACRQTCRLVYHTARADGADTGLATWWPGDAAPTRVAGTVGSGGLGVEKNSIAASYRSDGRLWVAWYDGQANSYKALLGDAKGAGGQPQDAGTPPPKSGEPATMGAIATADGSLAMLANWNDASGPTPFSFWADVVPATQATPAPGPRDATLQTSPGGKGFRIKVQFTVPRSCATPCSARAELRTRNGRRLYATSPLPGDGKIILGSRQGIKLASGRGRKVYFWLPVRRSELLRAPFSTSGGSRVAETRMRVVVRHGSATTLYVRDGRIKVSIARIRSGALPGLRGIL